MPQFIFEALTYSGKVEKGLIEADSETQAKEVLIQKDLVPTKLSLKKNDEVTGIGRFLRRKEKLKESDLISLTKQLALLQKSGLPLDESLLILADEHSNKAAQSIIRTIAADVRSGLPLSRALKNQTRNFDELFQGIVAAAEQSGRMSEVLSQLGEFLDKKYQLKQKALAALAYPLMLVGVSLVIILFLMSYVIPQITKVFESSKQTLPVITRVMINISYVITEWYVVLLLILITITYLIRFFYLKNKSYYHKKILNIPVLGPVLLAYETARFAQTLGILVQANVPILQGLDYAKKTLKNLSLQGAIEKSITQVREGYGLARAIGSQAVFPSIFIHLIRTGEASGKLAEMLLQAAQYAENEADKKTKVLSSLLEPSLILMMGLIVLLIVLAVMQPILDMNQGIR